MKSVFFLKLIRWKNLLLLLYVQLLLKFLVFPSFTVITNLSITQFIVLSISILLITSAGYIINDITDLKADLLNKPTKVIIAKHISIESAQHLYLITNSFGIISGIGLSLNIQKPTFSFIFIGASLLLYFYSKKFKAKPLIGNIVVSFLISFSIFVVGLFDVNQSFQNSTQQLISTIILLLSCFAFLLNLIREIVKDIEDVNGDYALNMRTLPILIGKNRSKKIAFAISIFPISMLLYIIINFAVDYKYLVLYLLFFVLIPLLFTALKLSSAKTIKDFHKVSLFLKISMFLGINVLVILSLNLQ